MICVTATSDDPDCKVDERFGRCKFFILVDPSTMKFKAVPNVAADASGGAGIKAANAVLKYAPAAIITGLIGDNALNVLKASSVKVYSCEDVSVREAVEMYNAGKLSRIDAPK
ncbi:NifB/NifX family molybdenum-iron cluster-binding protein [Methanocella conradii]|uniref:NifB/NifX family molybdenum-iron cluster-binding protein n=1 Tax=Methanocella conradii TaxID=1175444 RepID=UPI0024B35CE0|nr:NifB/NifX family molybdenum-iron cluster-binding protein [Methanocella conradii]MDI6896611.1 NifB/NifX family molybdenum-iron cluster-binding protein [Methanocella conradii]